MQLSAAGDLAAAATEHGSCEETPGAIIDRTRSGDGLRARAAELTWHVVLPSPEIAAHFDRDDWFTLRGVQFTVAAIPVSDAGVESTLAGAQSRTLTVEMSGFGGRQWPTDLPVLVGSETVEDGVYAPAYAAALYSDGIAFVGWCSAPATHDWNREVRRLQLDSHFDMLDMLIADPDNPMLDAPLGLVEQTPETSPTWEAVDPTERAYESGPAEARANLQYGTVAVLVPTDWHGRNDTGLAVCSRTPVAVAECADLDVAARLDSGGWGWVQQFFAEPGQPVIISLLDPARGMVDVVSFDPSEFADLTLDEGRAKHDRSLYVDFSSTIDVAATPDALLDIANLAELVATGATVTPSTEPAEPAPPGP
ncbi:MAG: hypothetical protein GY925_08785 [Actinomycetia bacterium]|nr:hypothetical protein [Actinomycetes bacterium]